MLATRRRVAVLALATGVALTITGGIAAVAVPIDETPSPGVSGAPSPAPTQDPAPAESAAPTEELDLDDLADGELDPAAVPIALPKGDENGPGTDPWPTLKSLEPAAPITGADDFADAYKLTGYLPAVSFDTLDATTEAGEPRQIQGGWWLRRTAWAKWTAPVDGHVTVSAEASPEADTGLAVYTGSTLATLKRVASNDQQYDPVNGADGVLGDDGPLGTARILSLPVKKGVTYRFQVGTPRSSKSATNAGTTGRADLQIMFQGANYVPKNDFLAEAATVKFGEGAAFSATALVNGSTIESWEPTDNDETPTNLRHGSVWYKFTAPQNALLVLESCTIFSDSTVAFFGPNAATEGSGAGFGDLKALGFDEGGNDGCGVFDLGNGANLLVSMTKGVTYYVQLANNVPGDTPTTASLTGDAIFLDPWIESISPKKGPKSGGNVVTITGAALNSGGAPTVKFGTKTADVLSSSANEIVVEVPSSTKLGAVKVTVTAGGDVSNAVSYSYR